MEWFAPIKLLADGSGSATTVSVGSGNEVVRGEDAVVLVMDEDFEEYAPGDVDPGGWTTGTFTDFFEVVKPSYQGKGFAANGTLTYRCENTEGETAEYSFTADSYSSCGFTARSHPDATTGSTYRFHFNDAIGAEVQEGTVYLRTATGYDLNAGFTQTSQKWFEYHFHNIDYVGNTYDCTIYDLHGDVVASHTGVSMPDIASIGKFTYYGLDGTEAEIDEVYVPHPSPATAPDKSAVYDAFMGGTASPDWTLGPNYSVTDTTAAIGTHSLMHDGPSGTWESSTLPWNDNKYGYFSVRFKHSGSGTARLVLSDDTTVGVQIDSVGDLRCHEANGFVQDPGFDIAIGEWHELVFEPIYGFNLSFAASNYDFTAYDSTGTQVGTATITNTGNIWNLADFTISSDGGPHYIDGIQSPIGYTG